MVKKTIWSVSFLLVLITMIAGRSAEPAPLKLNIMALSGTTGLSLVKVLADRPVLGPGVEAEYTVLKSPDQMMAKIITGEADIAALPTNTAAILYNKGVPIRLAAITNWGVLYVVGTEQNLRTWSDLKGKEIGLSGRGATPEILFRYFLQVAGVDPERELNLRYFSSPVELAQVLLAERISLAVLPEPWVTEVIMRNPRYRILLDFQAEWQRVEKRRESYPQSCLVVKADLAAARPEVVKEFLRQAALSGAWVNRYPAEAGKLAEEYVQISAAAAREAIPRCNLRFGEAGAVKDEVDLYLRRLYGFDPESVGGKVPDAGFYWPR
ncbi:MAG: ABC transporter substrate-binding protein [Firmicutes bacterium]|nr:ABC transporter substrate-binding protein [Bacillota bacterium]